MIVTDTGCKNILVVGNFATTVSRRVSAATETLTSVWPHRVRVRRSQHRINAPFKRRVILQSVLPKGGRLRRGD